jgi:cytochrome c556
MGVRVGAIVAAVAAIAVGATLVYAQNLEVIKQRRAAMKANGTAVGDLIKMSKGELPFDLVKVHASLKVFEEQAAKLKDLFPDDAKTGEDTAALPAIWEKKADFSARLDKLAADAKAAEGAIKDEASFKVELPKVAGDCGGCHKEYRRPLKQ